MKTNLKSSTAIPAQAARGPAAAKKSAPAKKKAASAPASDFGAKMKAAREAAKAKRDAAASNPAPADETELPLNEEITIYDELLDLTRGSDRGFAGQSVRENDKDYLRRMFGVIADAGQHLKEGEDDPFDAMSTGAQDYYNATVQAIEAGNDWVPPTGFVSKFGKKAEKEVAKGAKAAKAKAAKEPKPDRGPKHTSIVRTAFYKHLKARKPGSAIMTKEILEEQLKNAGHEINTAIVTTIRSDVLATIKVLTELDMWPYEPGSR